MICFLRELRCSTRRVIHEALIHGQNRGAGSAFTETVGDGKEPRVFPFHTGGRYAASTAYIIMMVKGMSVTSEDSEAYKNNKRIGPVMNNKGWSR